MKLKDKLHQCIAETKAGDLLPIGPAFDSKEIAEHVTENVNRAIIMGRQPVLNRAYVQMVEASTY